MARRDHPKPLRQPVEKRGVLREIIDAVQEQKRGAAAGDVHLDRGTADIDALHRQFLTSLRAERRNLDPRQAHAPRDCFVATRLAMTFPCLGESLSTSLDIDNSSI